MAALEALGSAFLVNVTQSMGCLTTKNFSAGTFEGAQAISGEHMAELLAERPNADAKHSCMVGCIVNCSQVYTDAEGNEITSGLEFETHRPPRRQLRHRDLDQIARIDRLCDDLGLDTMEVGAAAGVAMEGGLLEWGDGAGRARSARQARRRRLRRGAPRQRLLRHRRRARRLARAGRQGAGHGGLRPARAQGHRHDLRHHPAGRRPHLRQRAAEPRQPRLRSRRRPSGQAQISEFLQCYFAAIDSLGMCLFATLPALDMPELQGELRGGGARHHRQGPARRLPHQPWATRSCAGAGLQPARRVHGRRRPAAGVHDAEAVLAERQRVRRQRGRPGRACSRAEPGVSGRRGAFSAPYTRTRYSRQAHELEREKDVDGKVTPIKSPGRGTAHQRARRSR